MKTLGVDVSHWEGTIDWITASHWIPFAWYKCTDGVSGIDNTFAQNKAGCQQTGMPHAPYHYYQPGQDPLAQANHFITTAGRDYFRYIVDVEEPELILPAHLKTFLNRCEQLTGVKPAIYTSADRWNTWVQPKPSWSNLYELIVAHYTTEPQPILPGGWESYLMWQFSKFYYFPGSPCEVDGDWFKGDLQQARDWFGNYRQVDHPAAKVELRSHFDNLHVRLEPKVSSREVGHLMRGDVVILEEVGGQDVWVRHQEGWSAVEIDGYRYMELVK